MVVFDSNVTYAARLTARNIILEVAIKRLMLAVVDLQVSKVTSAMLSG